MQIQSAESDMLPDDHQTEEDKPTEATAPAGRRELILAGGLLLLCLLTAVGNWIYGVRPRESKPEENSSLSSSLFKEHADLGVIVIEGTIMHKAESSGFGSSGAASDRIVEAIRRAEKDGVKGLLLKINSPGGTAAASQSVYSEIQRVRKAHKMRVVAAMGDVAASGGYYIAAAADKIYANPATLTGSIGVIAQFTKVQGLYDKVGLDTTVIKSGKYKDIGSPFRDTSAEERQLLQALINDTYEDFLQAVSSGRKLPVAQVRTAADGRIYTGNQALKLKLVDALGDYNVALSELKKLTQTGEDAKVKDYSKPGFEDILSMLG
ncbi:MAG: signal peptide peptidase SppA, partial [Candidatus Melainabacteria bacterium HGW-Melainabacteria-1]